MTEKEQPFPIQLRTSIEQRSDEIAATLGPIGLNSERFMRIALLYVTRNKNLWECSGSSVLLAIMESARSGLMVDGKEAAIIPYRDEAVFMPMIVGIIRLMLRSPGVQKIEARCVYEGDDLNFQYGLNPKLDHVPRVVPSDDLLTHAYAIVWKKDTDPQFEIMTREEIEIVRASSRAKHGPWDDYYGEMSRKSVGKRLSKYVDLSPEAQHAIAVDHELFGDPQMDGFVDGLSEEYRNSQVKSQTQAGIARLKEEMANGAGGDVEVEGDVESGDEIERAEQFVEELAEDPKDAAPEKIDYTTEFWTLATKLEFTKEQAQEFVDAAGGDFEKAHKALKEQHGGPE